MWNSKERITKREYLKYNNPEAYDMQSKHVKPGDTVVFKDYYAGHPLIGIVDHYTESGSLAIRYKYRYYGSKSPVEMWAYRPPRKVIKIKNGNKSKRKDQ